MFGASATTNTSIQDIQLSQDSLFHALSSCKNLVHYLDADREIQSLAAKAKQIPSPSTHLVYNRWSIAWLKIESTSLHCFRKIFNYSKPYLINYFPNFTKKLQVKMQHRMLQHQTPYFKNLFKENLITRSLNCHQPESSDFYLHFNIKLRVRSIENGQCQSSSLSKKRFLMPNGICQGMCDWFTYLYFKTLPYYSDPEFHLQSIAKLFENGAPRQAELLQLFGWINVEIRDSILGFEIKKECGTNLLTIETLTEDKVKSSLFIKDLPVGVYSVVLSIVWDKGHSLRYFKINENLGFIFDPNIGLIKLAGNNQYEDLSEKLLNNARLLKSDDDSYFEFHQMTQHDDHVLTETKYTINVE